MATHASIPAWRIPGTGEPSGLPSMGSHRVRHNWSDLAAAAAAYGNLKVNLKDCQKMGRFWWAGCLSNPRSLFRSTSPFPNTSETGEQQAGLLYLKIVVNWEDDSLNNVPSNYSDTQRQSTKCKLPSSHHWRMKGSGLRQTWILTAAQSLISCVIPTLGKKVI